MPIGNRRDDRARTGAKKGLLARLARDTSGNTLAIVGAALVPLAGMIGSGVDMSRAYMAKTRLQSACDSAALAARRVLNADTAPPTVPTEVATEANRFFDANFPSGLYQTAVFEPVVTHPSNGTIRVGASTTIPTSIMHLFGFETLPLSVTCDASLNFVNTDIILVLDVTGSMAWNIDGSDKTDVPLADQRITALRDAVMALYDELEPIQEQLEANGLRLRFGVVPYSSTVNVGNLILEEDENYLLDSVTYQSRVANYTDQVWVPTDTPVTTNLAGLLVNPGVQRFKTGTTDRQISNTNCGNFGNNTGFSQSGTSPVGGTFTATGVNGDNSIYDPDGSAPPQGSAPNAPTNYYRYQFSRNTPVWSTNPANRVCDRNVVITRRTHASRFQYEDDLFLPVTYDTSQYKLGTPVTLAMDDLGTVATAGPYSRVALAPVATGVTTEAIKWDGCIEERQTVSTIVPDDGIAEPDDDLTIPGAATDLDINLIPNTDATRWRPMWPELAWRRAAGNANTTSGTSMASAACPAAAVRLRAWTETEMQTYVNALMPTGGTYHDTGMIWGARLLSPGGIFGDSPGEFNGMPVSRHIIFMSDGQMDTDPGTYGLYGIEQNERRVSNMYSPTEDELNWRHTLRYRMICNRTKTLPASIWTIALGTALTDAMSECATNVNQASTIASRDDLIARFREIGSNIGALRLTQ